MVPPLIALEEHYYSKAVYDSLEGSLKALMDGRQDPDRKVRSVGEGRLKDMDVGEITMQVVSHSVTVNPKPEICRMGNDTLANEISQNGDNAKRFAGFAVLPMGHPQAAAVELERTVTNLGFVGALVDNKVGDQFFDGAEYDVLWAKAQQLDVPIYLHPSWPTDDTLQRSFAGNYSQTAMNMIGTTIWGWHSEVGAHVLRLHAAGVFDRFPKLKIIIGHFGEMIPFMLHRVESMEGFFGPRERRFVQVWNENIWITTSGVWSLDPMRCILQNTNIDHIMFSVDYPYTSNEEGLKWIKSLEASGLVNMNELDMIAYKNAEKLLKLKTPSL